MPEVSDPDAGTYRYYLIKNFRSNKYAYWTGDNTQIKQSTTVLPQSFWYVTGNGDGTYKLHNRSTENIYAGHSSFTSEGATAYIMENQYKSGYVCISLSSDQSSQCWDDQQGNVGYWHPTASDNEGTSWTFEAVNPDDYTTCTVTLNSDYFIKVGENKSDFLIAASNADDNDHWYVMTQTRNDESAMYDNGIGNRLMRAAASVRVNGQVSSDAKYLVRFFAVDGGGYNVQFANGNFITSNLDTNPFTQYAGRFLIYNINNESTHIGWNLTTDGATYGSMVDNNGAGSTLAFWGTGQITSLGGNNDWSIYPVTFSPDPDEATITEIRNTFTNLKNAEKLNVLEGSTVKAPDEFSNAGFTVIQLNNAIDAANAVSETATWQDQKAFIDSSNGQIIQSYLNMLAQFGSLANIQFEMTGEYGTLCMPCPSSPVGGLKMYNCRAIDSDLSTLTLVEYTTRFEQNTPYIIQSTSENKKFTIIGWNKDHENIVNDGLLYGVLKEGGATVPANSYVLAREKSTNKQAFYFTDGTVTCPQYKCYLTVPAAAGNAVKAFYFENSGLVTSIESVMGADEETTIYNLNGQQLKRMQKGINIVNGRKIVVK